MGYKILNMHIHYRANVSWQSLETRNWWLDPQNSKASSIQAWVEGIEFQGRETQNFSRDESFTCDPRRQFGSFLQEPTLRGSQLCLRFCWSDVRTCMIEMERVRSLSVFLGSLPITTESIERVWSRKCCFWSFDSKDYWATIKHNFVRACFHCQLVKQRLKMSQSLSFASFTVKTGFSEQVIQSSVRRRHCYNPKSVDRK